MNPIQTKSRVKAKKVPAVDKCFKILELLAGARIPLGITEISTRLDYHKSTVFNLIYTLVDLGVLDMTPDNKVRLGIKLYTLGREAGAASNLIFKVRPFLEEINRKTSLSVFLGLCSGMKAVIVDKVDSPDDIKVSSELGMKIPLIAGAGGKVLLAQFPEDQVKEILARSTLTKFTPFTCTNRKQLAQMIEKARQDRFALDDEEYIEGIRALAIPLDMGRPDWPAAIWVVGLKSQLNDERIPVYRDLLKKIGARISAQFSL
jgi:IclR family KDG regulon transcriptional repressor